MKDYKRLKKLKPEIFKRLTGVTIDTFKAMLEECELYHEKKKARGGKPNKLSVSTQILLMLEYYREYRSMAHMAFDYEVSEATVSRVIKEIETVLLKSGKFSLPGKKALYKDDGIELEYILIDATECPVERPKKAKKVLQWKEKTAYSKRSSRIRFYSQNYLHSCCYDKYP